MSRTHLENVFCDDIHIVSFILNKEVRTSKGGVGGSPPYRGNIVLHFQVELGVITSGCAGIDRRRGNPTARTLIVGVLGRLDCWL